MVISDKPIRHSRPAEKPEEITTRQEQAEIVAEKKIDLDRIADAQTININSSLRDLEETRGSREYDSATKYQLDAISERGRALAAAAIEDTQAIAETSSQRALKSKTRRGALDRIIAAEVAEKEKIIFGPENASLPPVVRTGISVEDLRRFEREKEASSDRIAEITRQMENNKEEVIRDLFETVEDLHDTLRKKTDEKEKFKTAAGHIKNIDRIIKKIMKRHSGTTEKIIRLTPDQLSAIRAIEDIITSPPRELEAKLDAILGEEKAA
ncbi:MAG: hypothetical protein ACOZBH_04255 [Patescibacteria group bacterium]